MNVHFTYKLDKSPSAEQCLQTHIEKLGPRLQVFNPDMVSLRGLIEEAPKSGFTVALNLRLPSGQMAVKATAETLQAAIRIGFDDLTEQLRKHKEHLRSQYRFPRVRGEERQRRIEPQARFEDTVAAVKPEKVSSLDVAGFVNANLDRLRRYVERELRFRRDSGQRRLAEISVEEVIDEAIANALDEHHPRPEKIALEPWLYRLSRSAMDRLGNQLNSAAHSVRLDEEEIAAQDVDGEEMLQFYHPDERVTNENLIADRRGCTPEDDVSRQELMTMVERALRGATAHQREAFLLFTLEGFRLAEIAAITERTVQQVQADVSVAREHLRRSLVAAGERRQKLVNDRVAKHKSA